jgi:hypothetical protein
LILRKGFAVPSYRIGLSDLPRRAAIALAAWYVVVCPAGLLTRGVKPDVRNVYPGPERHAERLNAAIEVLIIQGILVVPDPRSWVGDFVTHEPNAISPRIRLILIYCCACPRREGGLHPHS